MKIVICVMFFNSLIHWFPHKKMALNYIVVIVNTLFIIKMLMKRKHLNGHTLTDFDSFFVIVGVTGLTLI